MISTALEGSQRRRFGEPLHGHPANLAVLLDEHRVGLDPPHLRRTGQDPALAKAWAGAPFTERMAIAAGPPLINPASCTSTSPEGAANQR